MNFDVWAPLAHTLELEVNGTRVPMVRDAEDWWRPEIETPWSDGLDYGYVIDGADTAVPDPRSRRQPHGVHALSRTFDWAAYAWRDSGWQGRALQGSVIYELHIGTFTPGGTFDSAVERLDYLVDLGVNFVEVMPVAAFNGTHNWGYDGVLWFAVHEVYGGPAGYQRFVDECHARGLGVVQDVVYNHLGPSGNYLPQFGPYLGSAGTTWGDALNLDGDGSAEVRQYILDNASMWFRDYHVDALRLDAVHALHDSSGLHVLAELSARTDALALELGRPLTLIAESDLNDAVMISPRGLGGYGMTAQWDDDYHHAAHVAVTGETFGYYSDFDSLAAFAKVLSGGFFHDGSYSSFRERNHGAPIDTTQVPAWRLVTFTQDHDQIGNRAAGDRPSQNLDENSLAIEAVLAVMTPFTPMLFMGQEWGATTPFQFFTSHPEPELGRATAEGRLAEFEKMGWDASTVPDPQARDTFTNSRLDWSELDADRHHRIHGLYRKLIAMRSTIVGDGAGFAHDVSVDEAERWLSYSVGNAAVVVNFSEEKRHVPTAGGELVFRTVEAVDLGETGVAMPPRSAAIILKA